MLQPTAEQLEVFAIHVRKAVKLTVDEAYCRGKLKVIIKITRMNVLIGYLIRVFSTAGELHAQAELLIDFNFDKDTENEQSILIDEHKGIVCVVDLPFTEEQMGRLCQFILKLPKIHTIEFLSCGIDDKIAAVLANELLSKSHRLHTLTLTQHKLHHPLDFLSALENHKTLASLEISKTDIDDSQSSALSEQAQLSLLKAINNHPTLVALNLAGTFSWNKISDALREGAKKKSKSNF